MTAAARVDATAATGSPPAENLAILLEQARTQLADREHRPVADVAVLSWSVVNWPGQDFDCDSRPTSGDAGSVPGAIAILAIGQALYEFRLAPGRSPLRCARAAIIPPDPHPHRPPDR